MYSSFCISVSLLYILQCIMCELPNKNYSKSFIYQWVNNTLFGVGTIYYYYFKKQINYKIPLT